jgi:hypothetical protein
VRFSALLVSLFLLIGVPAAWAQGPADSGLLFHLSGDRGLTADYAAGGDPAPNFVSGVKVLPGGASGPYLQCPDSQLLSYWAPGNIYAQRGTLAFYWRSRTAVDETEFPVFRVGYADHSSWDMVWLRIDYNGHGFDAFVTDVNLGRTRVSVKMADFPKPDQWTHLALAWDETLGIRFYVNGKLAAEAAPTGMFDAALDQFGPHSRLIGPTGVESSYNFSRGGDLDELRIYDRMLSDESIALLANGVVPQAIAPVARSAKDETWQKAWWFRYGWNRPGDAPPPLESVYTAVRKVEIHDAYDLKRWWWRATDGIRETTWPGVFNRSRLPGRNDYFQLPDWDCYSLSGKSITFFMPNEPWNYVTMSGGAWGEASLLAFNKESAAQTATVLFERPQGQEKTVYQLGQAVSGEKLRFTNVEQETPIGELSTYYVHAGHEPKGVVQLRYRLSARQAPEGNPSLKSLVSFINGRYPSEERQTMVAAPPASAVQGWRTGGVSDELAAPAEKAQTGVPLVHILIPASFRGLKSDGRTRGYSWQNMNGGLDGIAIDLPALDLKPTHGAYVAMNIQIKDPLWPMRNMLDFSFSVKPHEAHTLWLDTRDRILPNDKSLYLTIAAAGADFGPAALEGAEVRLVFKPYKDALGEHVADRLTQVKDNYANMVEESVSSERLNTYNRFYADMTDLLRVDPQNDLGRKYWYEANKEQVKPPFTLPTGPAGVPQWAFLQVTDLGYFDRFVNWYIDNRQIANGEFGGGLSDDSDLTDLFPGLAAMGARREKIAESISKELEADYREGLFTNSLATGQYDELHSYEDGINVLGQSLLLNSGSPKQLERAMATAKRLEWLTGTNAAGHRHFRSNYYSGSKMAEGGVWGRSSPRSYLVFQPALLLVGFNGSPEIRQMTLEAADGLLAHRKPGRAGRYATSASIDFKTDQEVSGRGDSPWYMFWAAYRWTGDQKYLQPLLDDGAASVGTINANTLDMLQLRDQFSKQLVASASGDTGDSTAKHLAWQVTGDTRYLESLYAARIEAQAAREYINTEGSLWIDRVGDGGGPAFSHGELQRARLGGILLQRDRIYPGNVVSWQFDAPATDQSVAILIPDATPESFQVTAYNLDSRPAKARMTGAEVEPGTWEVSQTTQGDPGETASTGSQEFERGREWELTLAPRTTTVLRFRLIKKGVPYWSRPDLGLDPEDVKVEGRRVAVTVHSLGSVDAPASEVVLRDRSGKVIARAKVPGLKAPVDLTPKVTTVVLTLPAKTDWQGGSVTVEVTGALPEITLQNNRVQVGARP